MGRRILRYTLNALTALSALLCAAACVLWVRSYLVRDFVSVRAAASLYGEPALKWLDLRSEAGRLELIRMRREPVERRWLRQQERDAVDAADEAYAERPRWQWTRQPAGPARSPFAGRHGFGFRTVPFGQRSAASVRFWGTIWTVPHWFLCLLFAALPAGRALAPRAARLWHQRPWRRPPGSCPACGYDLRATPGRCPECGTTPAP